MCMFADFPLMQWMKLPAFDRIHPQSNKFATDVENKTTGDSKLNDSLETIEQHTKRNPIQL